MSESGWMIIKDVKKFTNKMRYLVYNHFGQWDSVPSDEWNVSLNPEHQKDLDNVLSYDEASVIVLEVLKKQINKKTQLERYLVNDDLLYRLIEDLNQRMISNIVSGLVSKNLIEVSFDTEKNDFVFWIKEDENQNEKEKPETD